jgi:hypothetical protein
MLQSIDVVLNGVSYTAKQSYRALLLFEKEAGKVISDMDSSLNDRTILLFCSLKACNRDSFKMTYDEFLDAVEDDFANIIASYNSLLEKDLVKEEDTDSKNA